MNDLQPERASLTELVSGIVKDVQELIKHQLALFRNDLQEGSRQTKQAALLLTLGSGVLGIGGVLLSFALVYLLVWAAPALPLWASYGCIGVPVAILGGALFYAGINRFRSNLVPEQSTEALKENLQWLRNPK